jgi:hypothetical protein
MAERSPEKCKNYERQSEPGYVICYRSGREQKILKMTCENCLSYAEKK